ncbi:MAG: energy transducer TonB [FCB group bacterium]|nr:energy transducer TonB [FCB group bacterium]MBL7028289.1 energy transducer TonB [Candidatus Neomarinimicrobiota bacterium]MBL7121608.1 energy transducer TonB [Candidatus Neomarinimicrobiota bacterium]
MKNTLLFILVAMVIITGCVITGPLYYSANKLSIDEVEFLFDVDSVVNEMKYFDACIIEMNILPVKNWSEIKKEGVVGISALIDIEGKLEAALVIQSVHPSLDAIALQSVRQATFRSPQHIINVDTSYVLQILIPYYEDDFDLSELSTIYNYAYDEEMYDVAPEPVVGWEKAPLKVEYQGYSNMNRVEGDIQISFYIDSKGQPGQFYISKPFGYGAEEQAIKAIRKTKWKPATKLGKPVPCIVSIPFGFYYWY